MSKLRCYPPTGGHYGIFIGKDHYEVIVESCGVGSNLPRVRGVSDKKMAGSRDSVGG